MTLKRTSVTPTVNVVGKTGSTVSPSTGAGAPFWWRTVHYNYFVTVEFKYGL
ncbi:MAG: hypothetical protein IPN61_02625 [Bacteroidetes bacterium]|nr:hypothetical protein [Bacteroidota bacterium]